MRSEWMQDAVCGGNEAHQAILDDERATPKMVQAARDVCRGCPVVLPCAAQGKHESAGMWGGQLRSKGAAALPPLRWVRLEVIRAESGLSKSTLHKRFARLRDRLPDHHGLWRTSPAPKINSHNLEIWVSPELARQLRKSLRVYPPKRVA